MKKIAAILLLTSLLLGVLPAWAETSKMVYFKECPALPEPQSFIDVMFLGTGSGTDSRGPEYSYTSYAYKLTSDNRLGTMAFDVYNQMLEKMGFTISVDSYGKNVEYKNQKLATIYLNDKFPEYLTINVYGGHEKLGAADIVPTEATVAEIIPEKYVKDGKTCLVAESDDLKIYLTGKYKKESRWIYIEVIVENLTDKTLWISYQGNVNGWSVGKLGVHGFINSPFSSPHSKMIANIALYYVDDEFKEIGFDSVAELETLELTFRADIRKTLHETGKFYKDVSTGLVHLHAK